MRDPQKSFVTFSRYLMLTVLLTAGASAATAQSDTVQDDVNRVVDQCVYYENVVYNAAAFTAFGANISDLKYSFAPRPQSMALVKVDEQTRYFRVPAGTYTVTERNGKTKATNSYLVTLADCSGISGNGMTWRLSLVNSTNGVIRVGCGSSGGSNECNAYSGDTSCSTALPILCIKKSGSGFPLPKPASVDDSSQYNRWSGGIVGTTSPTLPPGALSKANGLCAEEFGAGWRVAEFHDGWGWYFQAIGGLGDPSSRFWVHINNQPANCWVND